MSHFLYSIEAMTLQSLDPTKNAHGANFTRLRLELKTGNLETFKTRLLTHIGADIQGQEEQTFKQTICRFRRYSQRFSTRPDWFHSNKLTRNI